MANRRNRSPIDLIGNIGKAAAVTPSDVTDLGVTDGLYVGVAGNLVVTMADGTDATFANAPVGYHLLRVQKVKAATAATNIVALYA